MSVAHATITVERRLSAPRTKVFAAWNGKALHKWYLPAGDLHDSANDFRVGGQQMQTFGPAGGPVFRTDGRYEDIVEGERIVTTATTHRDSERGSTTVCTVELRDDGEGTRLILTDQSAYYLGDYSAMRRDGWNKILDGLQAWLEGTH
jgi:uncharacterized protein YndB with AHSA1/START domain